MTTYTRKTRDTGELLTVCRPEDIGADTSEGPWLAYCETHGDLVYVDTRADALTLRGIDFCGYCQDEARGVYDMSFEFAKDDA